MRLEDLVDFEKGELIRVDWLDIQEHSEVSDDTRVHTCPSKSVGWFDEVFYGNDFYPSTATLVITKEVRQGVHVDKQAFPLGCVVSVERLIPSPSSQ